ncbi:porin [Shewanella youngdeokensis]|uniref:Porin n=1 Tax=Shewanella youngdeokensis TaxID=2999068 RepID=A0ABZ0K156_9GAMM|nr:porin [Shewanella sp. DAU334]
MKKRLILVSALTLTSFGTLADGPNLYGRLDLALSNSDTAATIRNNKDGTVLENNLSRLGLKGSESLTSNIELLYQIEFGVESMTETESSSGDRETFTSRDTFLGIKSPIGTVLVGSNGSAFKVSEGGIDAFGSTNADIDRLLIGQSPSRDGIWYYSPKIADLITINATYLIEDNYIDASDDDAVNAYHDQYTLNVMVGDKKLKAQPYYLVGAYTTLDGVDAYRAAGQVKIGHFKLGGIYQNTKSQTTTKEGDTYLVSVAYNLNGVNLKAQYGKDTAGFGRYYSKITDESATDINVQTLTVGADYKITKSTMLYGHYAMYEGDHKVAGATVDLDDDNIVTFGMRYNF